MRIVFAILLAGIMIACTEGTPTQPTSPCSAANKTHADGFAEGTASCENSYRVQTGPDGVRYIVRDNAYYLHEDDVEACAVAPDRPVCPECEDITREQKRMAGECSFGSSVLHSNGTVNSREIQRRIFNIIDRLPC